MAPSVTRQTALSRRRLALAACTLIATAIAFACSDLTPPPGAKLPHAPARTLDPGNVIVSPPNMHGWEFRDIENNSTCEAAGTCSLGKIVRGPATAPIGRGSGYLAVGTSTTSRKMALVTSDLSGTRLADITSLHYSSYRNSGGPYAVPIVFDVDYDLTDSVPGSQGIMIFLPTYTDTSLSPQGIWVDWDPLTTGKWGGTANSASLIHLGVQSTVPNQCHIALRSFGSGPCTWDNLKTMYPNIGIAVGGRFGFYVQETWGTWNGVTPGMGDFQGNVDDLEIAVSGISTTIDFDPGAVPVFPPTFTPAGFADTTELVPIAGTDTTYVHRSILLLKFARAATQAARQAAVDSVQGIVVGGQPLFDADGFYYVAVPAGAGSDSVINAARKLRQFSQVSFAGPNYYWAANSLAYLKPKDGSNWRTWRLSRDSVGTEHNWAEEMIELPNAWGCSVGDTSVHVGIIDHAFHTIADNASNVRFTDIINQRPTVHNDVVGTWHGDAVTNVLAAEGNNNTGVTGTTWKASVYRYELGHPDPKGGFVQKHGVDQLEGRRILPAIADLMVKNRVRVINLSLGSGAPRGQALNAAEDSIEQQKADLLHTTLAEMDSTSLPRPLLVIAADNRNRPASENGFARVRMYPSDSGNVLVVGATTNTTSHASTLASYSGYGNLVQIAAPGSSIYTIDAAGVEDSISGTSFATPQVAGAAALLMSFDPSLSPDSVKRLLVAGADSGGWTAAKNGTTHPILNAFWSLRLAARNRGAPLCGNRVWAEGGRIIVQRTDTTVRDSIVTGMPGTLNWLSPLHGGRTVLFVDDSLGALRTDWSPGSGWSTPIAYSGPPFDSSAGGGAYAPFHVFSGLSHDGDSTVFLMRSWGGFPKRMGIDVATDDGSSQDVQYTFTDLPVDSLSPILAIFAPKGGGRVLMTMPTSTGTTLYRFPASFGAPVTVHTFAARHVYGLSMNETETEYVVTSGDMTLTPLPFDESTSGDCKIQYMDTSFAVLQTISAPNGCRTAWNVWGNTYAGSGSHTNLKRPGSRLRLPQK